MVNKRLRRQAKSLPIARPSLSANFARELQIRNSQEDDFEILSNEDSSLCPCFERCWCCIKMYRQLLWLRLACAIASVLLIVIGTCRCSLDINKTFHWHRSTLDPATSAVDLAIDPFFSALGLYLVVILTEDKAPASAIKNAEDKLRPMFYGAAAFKLIFEVCPGVLLMISTLKMNKNCSTAFVFLMGTSALTSILQGIFAFILTLRALQLPLSVCRSGNGCAGYIVPELSIIFSSIVISCFRVHFFMCGFGLYKEIRAKIKRKKQAAILRPVDSVLAQDSNLSASNSHENVRSED